MKNKEGDDVHIPNQAADAIKKGFERAFWELWYKGQTPEEREIKWLPAKRPTQTVEEYLDYLWIVCSAVDPAILEIGVKGGHQQRFYEELLSCRHYEGLDIKEDTPATIVGSSHDPLIIQKLRDMEPDGWDIIFVDGNHSRVAARLDYENYKGLVRPGGFLAFHDTHHDHAEYCKGAAVLWAEIQKDWAKTWDIYYEVEYIGWATRKSNPIRKQCGIGLIQMPLENITDGKELPDG